MSSNNALARYETMAARDAERLASDRIRGENTRISALAWSTMGVRLEIAAHGASGDRAVKLRDRAADCRDRATAARAA